MTDRELMQQALEALEMYELETDSDIQRKAIAALRKRLAQQALDKMAENARELGLDYEPEQEPVAIVIEDLEHDGQGWCSKVRWLYNPVPVGETLSWEQPK